MSEDFFVHPSSYVDAPSSIGKNTKIWYFCHISEHVTIGENCNIGQNVFIGSHVNIGHRVKIQNNVSVYTGAQIDDDVFLGPSCVFTNVSNPRSQVTRRHLYEQTHLKKGCTIGANATIVCGVKIGRYAFVGAGAVVTKDVPDYALILGNPGQFKGWMSRHGHRFPQLEQGEIATCPESGLRYTVNPEQQLYCLDIDEDEDLPEHMQKGTHGYSEFK